MGTEGQLLDVDFVLGHHFFCFSCGAVFLTAAGSKCDECGGYLQEITIYEPKPGTSECRTEVRNLW